MARPRKVTCSRPVRPEREVWFEFGAAREVEGNGQALQAEIIDFIRGRLDDWRAREKAK